MCLSALHLHVGDTAFFCTPQRATLGMYVDVIIPTSLVCVLFDPATPTIELGCIYSLDWTTGLDYWTGLLDWTTVVRYAHAQIRARVYKNERIYFVRLHHVPDAGVDSCCCCPVRGFLVLSVAILCVLICWSCGVLSRRDGCHRKFIKNL